MLEEAKDETVPLLGRRKFLAIFSSNLDEFFMVRVARLKRLILEGDLRTVPEGLTAAETLTAGSRRVHELAEDQHLISRTVRFVYLALSRTALRSDAPTADRR